MKRLLPLMLTLGLLGAAFAQTGSDTYIYQKFSRVVTLDPVKAYDTTSGALMDNLYERLVGYVEDDLSEYEGLLATDWEISEDGTLYTYTLREGVVFHSGNAFTCRDVEYSIQRALVINPPDAGVWFLAESFLGTQDNADAYVGEDGTDEAYAEYWQRIDAAVECLDDSTVRFTLPEPDATFFVKMMANPASIVDSQWAIDNGMWDGSEDSWRDWVGADMEEHYLHTNVSGTGAYRLVSWEDETVVAERFEDYWGEQPQLQTVITQQVDEQSARILAIQQGDADRVWINERATLGQLRGSPGVVIHENDDWVSTVANVLFFNHAINTDSNPDVGSGALDGRGIPADFFADIDLRKCFAYSFDQDQFIEQLYEGQGVALTMALAATFPGYNPDIEVYNLDPERAEEHCRAAHGGQVWEQGFEFTATYNTGNTVRQTALEIIKDNVEFLNPNFRMNIRDLAWPDFLNMTQAAQGTMFALGWAPSYADPDYYIHTFYHEDGVYSGRHNFRNEELTALVEEARAIPDLDERVEIYYEIGRVAHELVPVLPYPSPLNFIVTRDNIEGIYLNPLYGDWFLWKDVRKN